MENHRCSTANGWLLAVRRDFDKRGSQDNTNDWDNELGTRTFGGRWGRSASPREAGSWSGAASRGQAGPGELYKPSKEEVGDTLPDNGTIIIADYRSKPDLEDGKGVGRGGGS